MRHTQITHAHTHTYEDTYNTRAHTHTTTHSSQIIHTLNIPYAHTSDTLHTTKHTTDNTHLINARPRIMHRTTDESKGWWW